jgi:hypothetical protein
LRKLSVSLFAGAALLALVFGLAGAPARANALVHIQDDAKILSAPDQQQITAAAQSAPFSVVVWTSSTSPDKDSFYNAVRGMVGDDQVVVGVDPVHKWSHISAKANTGLTANQVTQASTTANTQFGNGQWAAGITEAINNLAAAAPAGGGAAAPVGQPAPAPAPGGGLSLGACLIPLLLIGVVVFFLGRRLFSGARRTVQPMQPTYPPNQGPYNQGPYNPQGGYQQGGSYNQQPGSGIGGNIASGGLGALAGGVIGYEIGRNTGQNQQAPPPVQGGFGGFAGDNSGIVDSAPGGSGADFGGGGGGADFGGGGGGADFGGGSGGGGNDFGGGGDVV